MMQSLFITVEQVKDISAHRW